MLTGGLRVLCCFCRVASQAAAQRKLEAKSPRHGDQHSRHPTGRRSSGSASLPSSSTASQAASSSSTVGGLQQPRPAAGADSIAINIIPDFVPRTRSGAAAAAGAGAGTTAGTSTSSSSTAAGALSSGSTSHGPPGHHGSSEGAGSSASVAHRMFTRLWKYQQQDVPEHMLSGPSTGRRSQEQSLRTAVTPLSSAAYTLFGSSSMGTVPTGTSAHTAAGVISSTQEQLGAHAPPAPRSVSSSGTGAGTSGELSSQGMTVSSGSQDSSSGAAVASGEIQPAPSKPVMGWLRRSSKHTGDAADVLPATDSGSDSSKAGSPAAPAGAGASQSSSQTDPDELQVCREAHGVPVCDCELACMAGHKLHASCEAMHVHPGRPCTRSTARLLGAVCGCVGVSTHGVQDVHDASRGLQ